MINACICPCITLTKTDEVEKIALFVFINAVTVMLYAIPGVRVNGASLNVAGSLAIDAVLAKLVVVVGAEIDQVNVIPDIFLFELLLLTSLLLLNSIYK